MATLTFNQTATVAAKATASSQAGPGKAAVVKKSIFARLIDAIAESNRRKAEIHIRRTMASMDSVRSKPDYAMLPFQGE